MNRDSLLASDSVRLKSGFSGGLLNCRGVSTIQGEVGTFIRQISVQITNIESAVTQNQERL